MDPEPVDAIGPGSVSPDPAEAAPADPDPAEPREPEEPEDPEVAGVAGALVVVRGVTRTRAGLPMKPKVDGTGSSRTSMSTWSE